MKKVIFLFVIFFSFHNCNKTKTTIKENMHLPDYSYKNAGIDQFYYLTHEVGNSTPTIPLLKPYIIYQIGSSHEWFFDTDLGNLYNELGGGISPLINFNVYDNLIYGYKSKLVDEKNPNFIMPEKWFILSTQEKKLTFFDKESDFKVELRKLHLPETFLNPDEIYEQYKKDPVLPWFPENIKKQLEEVKLNRENK